MKTVQYQRGGQGSVMFRFVAGGSGELPQKRRQTNRACEHCRKRKKRCVHSEGPVGTGHEPCSSGCSPTAESIPISKSSTHNSLGTNTTSQPPDIRPDVAHARSYGADEDRDLHFVGDLNPQGIFLAATTPETVDESNSGGVGVWLSRRAVGTAKALSPDPALSRVVLPLLEDGSHRLLPKAADVEALISIYLDEIHPIFPAVRMEAYNAMSTDSQTKIILTQAICLAASSNTLAKPFLTLSTDTPMCNRLFAKRMSSTIQLSLDLRLVTDKIVLIQLLLLLSLFTQLSEGSHTSSDLLYQTVGYAHTLGLHLQAQETRPDHREMTTLFCCLWALDRLNAAFHGRPVLMHERDSGRDLAACFDQQEDCFRLFLRVVLLLDKVINLYRPSLEGASTGWETEFPSFEDLVYSSCSPNTSSRLLATIETLYHAVAMLSCRSQSLKEPKRSSASYVRQCFSAVRVTSIVGKEFRGQLSQFPIVPYAVSLATRFYYRELRLSKAPIFRTRALSQLQLACAPLRELGAFFSSTMFMVEMVEQTIHEMHKVCSTMVNNHDGEGAEVPLSRGDSRGIVDLTSNSVPLETSLPSVDRYGNAINERGTIQHPVDYGLNASESFMLENIPADFDIFEHFDPDFDLHAIDAFMGDPDNFAFPTLPDGSI